MVDERTLQNGRPETTGELSETPDDGKYSRASTKIHEKAFVPISSAGHIGWQPRHEHVPQLQEHNLICEHEMETGISETLHPHDHESHLIGTMDHAHAGVHSDVSQGRWAQFRSHTACTYRHPEFDRDRKCSSAGVSGREIHKDSVMQEVIKGLSKRIDEQSHEDTLHARQQPLLSQLISSVVSFETTDRVLQVQGFVSKCVAIT